VPVDGPGPGFVANAADAVASTTTTTTSKTRFTVSPFRRWRQAY
jgi:hypothetical protein